MSYVIQDKRNPNRFWTGTDFGPREQALILSPQETGQLLERISVALDTIRAIPTTQEVK